MTDKIIEAVENLPPLRTMLAASDMQARKSLGQNFLFDLNLTSRIARTALPFNGPVIEIGPGPGGLTRALLIEGAEQVIAIEKDSRVFSLLQPVITAASGRLELIEADALKVDLDRFTNAQAKAQIVANLPYNVATPLYIRFLKLRRQISGMSLMFQKEVAERITALPSTSAYGRLAVLTHWCADAELMFHIPPEAFVPPPKVTSSVVRIIPRVEPRYPCSLESLEAVTQIAFGQRRKMLRASFKAYGGEEMLASLDIDPALRPQDLDVASFSRIAEHLAPKLTAKTVN